MSTIAGAGDQAATRMKGADEILDTVSRQETIGIGMDQFEQTIFAIDDEPVNLRLLEKMLRGQGYGSLVLIQDPRQFPEQYRLHRPSLILLDINMPHLDGYQVMEQLRDLRDPLAPPVVVLTAEHSKEHMLRALTAGARDFVSKPFDRNELLMRVRNLLEAHLALRLQFDQSRKLEEMVRARTVELRASRLQVVQRLCQASEYRDPETGNHIIRMSRISALLAGSLGWDENACELMLHASPMHDVGKIAIPDAILNKPGKLDPAEFEVMKEHATIGARLLDGDDSDLMRLAREIARSHHEKWDGSGYPEGLRGEAIPPSARIVALADVFDALTSERPYKKAWTVEEAVAEINKLAGNHFDPDLVRVFMQNIPAMVEIRDRFNDRESS